MSCSTCLNHEKQPLKCVLDENGKSLEEYLQDINTSLKKIQDVLNAPIDGKGIQGNNISELVQSLINKVTSVQNNSNVFSEKFYDSKGQVATLQETLVSVLKRLDILEKRNTTSSYI